MNVKLPISTLMKIYAAYYNAPCKYKSGDVWIESRLTYHIFQYIESNKCMLLLKPIQAISLEDLCAAESMMRKMKAKERNEDVLDPELTAEEKSQLKDHFLDNDISDMNYPLADYLRRLGYHIPIYGLDLFRAGIAKLYIKNKDKDIK